MTELITTKEAAVLLKCDPSTINSYVRKGKLRTAQDGIKRLFEREIILNFQRPIIPAKKGERPSIKRLRSRPNFNRNVRSNNVSTIGLDKSDFKEIVEKWRIHVKDSGNVLNA